LYDLILYWDKNRELLGYYFRHKKRLNPTAPFADSSLIRLFTRCFYGKPTGTVMVRMIHQVKAKFKWKPYILMYNFSGEIDISFHSVKLRLLNLTFPIAILMVNHHMRVLIINFTFLTTQSVMKVIYVVLKVWIWIIICFTDRINNILFLMCLNRVRDLIIVIFILFLDSLNLGHCEP